MREEGREGLRGKEAGRERNGGREGEGGRKRKRPVKKMTCPAVLLVLSSAPASTEQIEGHSLDFSLVLCMKCKNRALIKMEKKFHSRQD